MFWFHRISVRFLRTTSFQLIATDINKKFIIFNNSWLTKVRTAKHCVYTFMKTRAHAYLVCYIPTKFSKSSIVTVVQGKEPSPKPENKTMSLILNPFISKC